MNACRFEFYATLALSAGLATAPAHAADPPTGPIHRHASAASAAAPAASAAASAAAADPLEHLRKRLAERLGGGRSVDAGGPNDLRVVAKTAPARASGAAAKVDEPGHEMAVGPAPRKGGEAHAHAHWDYAGAAGPQAWGALKPEFSLCASGQRQSPIDIRGGLAVDLDPVRFDYQASRFAVIDNGHTVQVNVAPGNAIEVGGRRYELQQFHFHRPAEERIDGRSFEMSVHLVHKDEQGRLAVVTVLLEKGLAQPVVQKVWNNLPLERNEESVARTPLELPDLLPADRRYYSYMGSLTTPPCSEGVHWIVMRQPVGVTTEQVELFARIYPMNARPLQAASGRRIMQSN
jgi:carbonic anhydrase